MGTKRMTLVATVLGTVAAAGLMGCNHGQNNASGAASVSVSALSVSDVASVTVSVQGAGMASPLVVPLVKKGPTQFSALVSDLPVGTDYAFTASAKDPNSVELYHGGVTGQSIVKNQTANIVIDMNQVAPGVPMANSAPVIDSITATSLSVSNNDTVTINATAHDPDAGQTALMTWAWASTCGASTLSPMPHGTVSPGTDMVHGASTITFTAPATDGDCTVNLTVTDFTGGLSNVASLTIHVNAATGTGNAKIIANLDTFPVISGLGATPVPLVRGQPTTLTVSAIDADNDALNYHWSSTNCSSGSFGPIDPLTGTTTFTLDPNSAATSCDLVVVVDDGNYPDSTPANPKPKGGVITNHLTLPVFSPINNVPTGAPMFGFDYQSRDTISGGDVVGMAIVASCPAGGTLSPLVWASDDQQALGQTTPAALGLDGALFNSSAVTYTAIPGAEDNPAVTITVTASCSNTPLTAMHHFVLVGANNFCALQPAGTDCTGTARGTDKCVLTAQCNASHQCAATSSVSCTPSSDPCQINACDTTDGQCKLSPALDSTHCNDGNACTNYGSFDVCTAGVCGGTQRNCPASDDCHTATCDTQTGACGNVAKQNGQACANADCCTTGSICTNGVCGGTHVSCNAGQACSLVSCQCEDIVCMNPIYEPTTPWVPPFSGMGTNQSGIRWAAGQIYNPFNFGSGTVTSSGSADIYLAELNSHGVATQTFTFGDKGGKDQSASGVAVASAGNVGLIGKFAGEVDFTASNSDGSGSSGQIGTAGFDFLSNASAIPFYGVFDGASTGTYVTPKTVHMVDVGTGAIMSIGSNPSVNAFAICGKTSKLVTNWNVNGATKGVLTPSPATPPAWTNAAGGGMDIVVAKIDASTGAVIWGRQLGGLGDQICESVTLDSAGNVIIAGNYSGTLVLDGTTLPAVNDGSGNPDANRAILFVAKLDGRSLSAGGGVVLAAQSWGTAGRNDAYSVTADKDDNIIVAGAIGGNVDFGGGYNVIDLGATDAFVAKLSHLSLATTVWAESFGDASYDQTINSVSTASSGDVYIAGSFEGSLGALGLISASNTAVDGFTAELSGSTGAPINGCAHKYGDALGAQAVSVITVARPAVTPPADTIMIGGSFTNYMDFGGHPALTPLFSGGPGIAASYVTVMTP